MTILGSRESDGETGAPDSGITPQHVAVGAVPAQSVHYTRSQSPPVLSLPTAGREIREGRRGRRGKIALMSTPTQDTIVEPEPATIVRVEPEPVAIVSGESGPLHRGAGDGRLSNFVVSVPGVQRDHIIAGELVRSALSTVRDLIGLYADLLSIPDIDTANLEMNLQSQFISIREEFSDARFCLDALDDAEGFIVPVEVWSRDSEAYELRQSLEHLVEDMQGAKSADRFNLARCQSVFAGDPEYDRLCSLASDGVIIDLPEGLVLENNPGLPRRLQCQMPEVYLKHAVGVWAKGDGVLMKLEDMSVSDRRRLHFNPPHLTYKADEKAGRFLMDCSNSESGQVLNTADVKVAVIERYGLVTLPTLPSIVTAWYVYVEEQGVQLRDCRLFKDDFKGAFAQMNVNPASSYLLAMAVGLGLVLIYTSGLFGWLGFPMAFAVLSRAFERKLRADLDIPVFLYVDDVFGLSLATRVASDQQHVERVAEDALGPRAINFKKQVLPCLACDVLGWHIDLEDETFRPNNRGIRKLVFAFWMVAAGKKFPLVVYQLLASLAERYSLGWPGMAPFVYPLHGMTTKFNGHAYARKAPSSACWMAIEVWRVVSILALQGNPNMCRPLRSLVVLSSPTPLRFSVFTDASPIGLGIGVFNPNGVLLAYMAYMFPFRAIGGSEYQCAREYFGYMFIFFFLEWVLGGTPGPIGVGWINDNAAAIAWAEEGRCKSLAGQYAFLVVTWHLMSSSFRVTQTEHQAGFVMGDIDRLSRGMRHDLDPRCEYILDDQRLQQLDELFSILDPSVVRNLEDHHYALSAVISVARALSRR